MQELRFVAVSEDGSYAVLAVPGRSARFILPIDERLRAVALGQTSRLVQYEIEVESPLRPKEIQARIRAGETAEEIADAAGIPVERVRWFEGPVLAERSYVAQQAQTATVRRQGDSAGPGPRLGDIVTERIGASGGDPEEGQWDSRKRGDSNWQVQLTYSAGGRLHIAEWKFDPRRRHVMPEDDTAARLSLPESDLPPEPESVPGEATVTPIASRLGAAAGMGGGMGPGPAANRFRAERPAYQERAATPERPPADRPGAADRPPAGTRPPVGDRPADDRPAAYAQPSATPPVPPRPVAPAPARDSERIGPTPPAPPSEGRRAGAPWSDSARRGDRHAAYQGDYQPGDYQFEDDWADSYQPEPAREQPEPAPEHVAESEPEPAAEAVTEPAAAEPAAQDRPAPAAAEPEPVTAAEPEPEPAAASAKPGREEAAPAAQKEPAEAAKKETAAKKEPAEAGEKESAAEEQQTPRPRPARKNARNRRSSVPSWDEIMLGSSRQRD